ncbi:bifunctional DNA primase/polymerase [Gemmata sp. SH-PL17]|uniref:bifunctional DNA primase/polymerase n=1 Tax=Gemmata sp. SH-PL17 TaxID=1630693 RepID=UPI0039657D6B
MMGCKVFPCHTMRDGCCSCGKADCTSAAKHPAVTNGCKGASSDPEQIRKWWGAFPDANIGLATGTVSGVWVLDVDGPEGCAALAELEQRHGKLPETVVAKTAKGEHYFFRIPDGVSIRSLVRALPEVDTRGDGGYVIVPESDHRSGVKYLWVQSPEEIEIAFAPAWLLELVTRTKRSSSSRSNSDEAFAELAPDLDIRTAPGAPEGQRHNRACRLIGSALGRRVPIHVLTAYALAWALRCAPPMDEEEVLGIIGNLSEKDADSLDDFDPEQKEDWPVLRPEALYGLAGDVVRTIEPETEADPVAILVQFLVMFGCTIGRVAHSLAEATKHFGNLFAVIVGETAQGRKGTSFGRVQNVFEGATGGFPLVRKMTGLSSGEGLIWQVRDPIGKEDAKPKAGATAADTQGVTDKRLLVVESEFASVLAAIKRDANTLSPIIREAWDTGNLQSMVKNSPARARNAHIAIIGHITRYELKSSWPSVEGFNGFANRFLWVLSRRSKSLPEGGGPLDLSGLQKRLSECIEFAANFERMVRDEDARKLWASRYSTLGSGRAGSVASVIARAQPIVMRLSMLYALLDRSPLVRCEHLAASYAVWDYCEASAVLIFGQALGNQNAERILTALRQKPMATKEIHRLFNNRLSASELKSCLEMLLSQRRIRLEKQPTAGRPANVWHIS